MRINEFKLEEYFAKYEFTVKYLLCASDCESFSVNELLALRNDSLEELKKLRLGYTESFGHTNLRHEISKLYDNIEPEEIIVFSGAEEGIFIFMNVFLEKRDHLIVQYPAYQSLFEIANSLECQVTKWIMSDDGDWDLNLEFLKSNIKKSTKCIVVNFPHNPTGYLPTKEKFEEILNIAKKNEILIFSDEVYRFLEYDESYRLPAMCDLYDNGISLGVMSKAFGLAGLRIGWIATKNKSLLKQLASFKNYTSICNSALSEFFSILALQNRDVILKRNLDIIQANTNQLDTFFNRYKNVFKWIKPKAGSIAFPRMITGESVEKFCSELLEEESVLLMPSTNYDFGDHHFRIGFGRRNMPQALERFEKFIVNHY